MGAEVEALIGGIEGRAGNFRAFVTYNLQDRDNFVSRGQDHQLHIATIFGNQHIASRGDNHVVDARQDRIGAGCNIVDHLQLLTIDVVGPDPVIVLGSEIGFAIVQSDAFSASKTKGIGHLAKSRGLLCQGIGDRAPEHEKLVLIPLNRSDFQCALRQIGEAIGRPKPVEAAIRCVLG